jgi:transcriptional regulator with XRE-family HTH domain/quercetin dioxygenase-like cupin family protein
MLDWPEAGPSSHGQSVQWELTLGSPVKGSKQFRFEWCEVKKMVGVESTNNAANSAAPSVGPELPMNLGLRLREVRLKSGLSLRAVARELGVSPSFVSQLENDRSKPSVATLYSLSQLLNVSLDQLFEQAGETTTETTNETTESTPAPPKKRRPALTPEVTLSVVGKSESPARVRRSDLGSPAEAWGVDRRGQKMSITKPGQRSRLVLDSGVVWEQLSASIARGLAFLQIEYPPGSSSANNDRMLRHGGYECGFLLDGELEITVGFETTTLHAGEALGFDCSTPHLFRNLGSVTARGIWCVFDQHPSGTELS